MKKYCTVEADAVIHSLQKLPMCSVLRVSHSREEVIQNNVNITVHETSDTPLGSVDFFFILFEIDSAMMTMRISALLATAASVITLSHGFSAQVPTITSPARSYVELIEPETGCQVVLLGCLHGSSSSADDVRYLLSNKTDVVVLELCASRMTDLRREAEDVPVQQKSSFGRYVNMVTKTNEKSGMATASAAAVLGGVSVLQTALSGFDPGLEFSTAIKIADEKKCDLLLADRTVDETLQRMGKLPSTSLDMLQSLIKERNWEETLGKDAQVLRGAVFGNDNMDAAQQVKMGSVLFRNKAAVEDLARMSVPPILLTLLISNFVTDGLAYLFPEQAAVDPFALVTDVAMSSQEVLAMVAGATISVLFQVLTLVAGYTILALPAVRVILSERDSYLTRGVQEACRLQTPSGEQPERVVAVLGLLHVNGVAKQLLENENSV